MSANKKRRKLPEEDLAAAVAEIINSPITRSNLSFLRPLAVPASQETEQAIPKPMGVEVKPMGPSITPMGHGSKPMGDGLAQKPPESPPVVAQALPAHDLPG